MTNYERGENLLNDAEIYYEDMQLMFEKGKWNIVVRRLPIRKVLPFSGKIFFDKFVNNLILPLSPKFALLHAPAPFFLIVEDLFDRILKAFPIHPGLQIL
jgi:hypothetical protein